MLVTADADMAREILIRQYTKFSERRVRFKDADLHQVYKHCFISAISSRDGHKSTTSKSKSKSKYMYNP